MINAQEAAFPKVRGGKGFRIIQESLLELLQAFLPQPGALKKPPAAVLTYKGEIRNKTSKVSLGGQLWCEQQSCYPSEILFSSFAIIMCSRKRKREKEIFQPPQL